MEQFYPSFCSRIPSAVRRCYHLVSGTCPCYAHITFGGNDPKEVLRFFAEWKKGLGSNESSMVYTINCLLEMPFLHLERIRSRLRESAKLLEGHCGHSEILRVSKSINAVYHRADASRDRGFAIDAIERRMQYARGVKRMSELGTIKPVPCGAFMILKRAGKKKNKP